MMDILRRSDGQRGRKTSELSTLEDNCCHNVDSHFSQDDTSSFSATSSKTY